MAKSYTTKTKTKSLILLIALFIATGFVSFSQTIHKGWIDGQIYFKIKNNSTFKVAYKQEKVNIDDFYFLKSLRKNHNITKLTKTFWISKDENLLNTYLLEFSDYANIDKIIEELKAIDVIEYAEMAPFAELAFTPNDPMFNPTQSWALYKIGAQAAWNVSRGDKKRIIAIVDDAFAFHPDLDANFWKSPGEIIGDSIDNNGNSLIDEQYGWDVADNDNDPMGPSTWTCHGNFVAGLASAVNNNGLDISSIGDNVTLMLIKTSQNGYNVTYAYQGVVWAQNMGADVINMSWKFTGPTTTQQNIMTAAYNAGVVLVAAAGNSGTEIMNYPASYNEVIGVAATDTADVKCNFSDYSTAIDVSAPGMGLYTTLTSSVTTGPYYGTSFCTPIVSGLAGLMLSYDSTLTPLQVMNCIKSTADNIDVLNPTLIGKIGTGRINAAAAMACISGTTGISNYDNIVAPLIFPNPSNGVITISTKYEKVQEVRINVYNLFGEKILQNSYNHTLGGKYELNLTEQTEGMYLVELISGSKTFIQKISITK